MSVTIDAMQPADWGTGAPFTSEGIATNNATFEQHAPSGRHGERRFCIAPVGAAKG